MRDKEEIYKIRKQTINKIKGMLKSGEVGNRRFQKYNTEESSLVNCLFHAIFNFSNSQLKKLKLTENDKEGLKYFFDGSDFDQSIDDIKNFSKKCGLILKDCDYFDPVQPNERRILLLYRCGLFCEDFHLYRLETKKSGKIVWTSKIGFTKTVTKLKHKKVIDCAINGSYRLGSYELYASFKVINKNNKNKPSTKNQKPIQLISNKQREKL